MVARYGVDNRRVVSEGRIGQDTYQMKQRIADSNVGWSLVISDECCVGSRRGRLVLRRGLCNKWCNVDVMCKQEFR